MFQIKFVEKIKTNFLFSIIFFFFNCAAYEIMWKNNVEPDSPQKTIRRIHIACWIIKPTDTHTQNMKCLLIFYCNNICTSTLECYVISIFPALFNLTS